MIIGPRNTKLMIEEGDITTPASTPTTKSTSTSTSTSTPVGADIDDRRQAIESARQAAEEAKAAAEKAAAAAQSAKTTSASSIGVLSGIAGEEGFGGGFGAQIPTGWGTGDLNPYTGLPNYGAAATATSSQLSGSTTSDSGTTSTSSTSIQNTTSTTSQSSSGSSTPSASVNVEQPKEVSPVPPTPAPEPPKPTVVAKSAPMETILYDEDLIEPETMFDLIFEDIGGHELISIVRNDTVNGQNIIYQPIKNLGNIQNQYNSNNIIANQETSREYFANFQINIDNKIPNEGNGPNGENIYIDDNGSLIIEFVNISSSEQVEIQIASSGTIYEADI